MTTEPSGRVAEIAASPPGPQVGAFFDLDGTLVSGFTATAHAGDRIRRRQARVGEVLGVLEASIRYRLGRMQFERLIVRAAGYLKGESLHELDELGERLFVQHIESRVYPHMREIVAAHRQRGHTLALCSSALTIHAEPVARALGITRLLCNHFEVDESGHPALRAAKVDLSSGLKAGGRNTQGDGGFGTSRRRLRSLLVVSEVALSLMLLIGAGLLVRSFVRLQSVSPGFTADNVISMRLGASGRQFPNRDAAVEFYRQFGDRLASVPG